MITLLTNQGKPRNWRTAKSRERSEEHTSELQSPDHLVCRLLLEKKTHLGRAKYAVHQSSARGGRATDHIASHEHSRCPCPPPRPAHRSHPTRAIPLTSATPPLC